MINKDNKIGFIGAGNMASALISGLVNARKNPNSIMASSPEDNHLESLSSEFGILTTKNNVEIAENCEIILLAVKPHIIEEVLKGIASYIKPNKHLIISIAAGVKIEDIQALLSIEQKIIRAMPNTPASIQRGVTALCNNSQTDLVDKNVAEEIFKSVSVTCWLQEDSLDQYTALIGSGPAYVFYFIEAMLEASKDLNLEGEDIKNLLIEMIIGSSELAKMSSDEPSILRKKVTSPGGVTERAIEIFEEKKIKQSILTAIKEATQRSIKLGNK